MFAQAIEDALAYAMEKDSRIMVLGEDVHMLRVNLYSCFGDADGLMLTAIEESSPVIFCEHKLLADYWRDYLGSGGRDTVSYNVPEQGQQGAVPDT